MVALPAAAAAFTVARGLPWLGKSLQMAFGGGAKTSTSIARTVRSTGGLARRAVGPAGLIGTGAMIPGLFGGNGANGANGGGPSAQIVGEWSTGTAEFFRLANGKIGTYKANGVWKEWKPYRPVVIPRRWNARSMNRVAKAMERQQDTAIKIVRMGGGEASKTKRAKTKFVPTGRGRGNDIINVG